MASHRRRRRVVIDTNVWVRGFDSARHDSFNRQVIRQWHIEKRLVSREVLDEYLHIFETVLEFHPERLARWTRRFNTGDRVTLVDLGPRVIGSRDPDDNVFLSLARTGRAATLVTNDRDLLELPS